MMVVFAQSSGMVQGAWSYVIGAYAVTWLFFVGYTVSLWLRAREGAR